jgi:excisionase family DNA binding protein
VGKLLERSRNEAPYSMSNDGYTPSAGERSPAPLSTPDNRGWVSMKQLAALLERDYRTVRKWLAERRVHSIQVGGQYRIMEEEVRYILENGTRQPSHDQHGNPLPGYDTTKEA